MEEYIFAIHKKIVAGVEWIVELALWGLLMIVGLVSFWFPVSKIWTEVLDGNFSLLKSVSYILIGIAFFYIMIALDKVLRRIK